MDELPLHIWGGELAQIPEREYVDTLGKETKGKILQFHDPVENIAQLEAVKVNEDVQESRDKRTLLKIINQTLLYQRIGLKDPDVCKIYRIFHGNGINVCDDSSLYSKSGEEKGLYSEISLINHSCNPNALQTWVMDDFKRKEVRALKVINVHEEILINYAPASDMFNFGSREFRRRHLLENFAFLCSCSECSMTGESLLENERARSEIREKNSKIDKLVEKAGKRNHYLDFFRMPIDQKSMKTAKKFVKINKDILDLVKQLDIQLEIPTALMCCFDANQCAEISDLNEVVDSDHYRREALEYCEKFGASHVNFYNRSIKDRVIV